MQEEHTSRGDKSAANEAHENDMIGTGSSINVQPSVNEKTGKRSKRKTRVRCWNCNAPHHESVCEWPCIFCFTVRVLGTSHICNREWILRYYCSINAYKKYVLDNVKMFGLKDDHIILFLKQNKNRLDEEYQRFAIDDDVSTYEFSGPPDQPPPSIQEPVAKKRKPDECSPTEIEKDVEIVYELVTLNEDEAMVPQEFQNLLDKEGFSMEGEERNIDEFGKLRICGFNLRLLRPGQAPNDCIMDSYLKLIVERNSLIDGCPKIFRFPALLYRILDIPSGFSMVLDYLPANLLEHDIIFIPLLIESHWILFVADIQKQLYFVYDSVYEYKKTKILCMDEYRRCIYLLKRFAENHQIYTEIDSWKKIKVNDPAQENLIDCGIYVAIFAEKYAKRQEPKFSVAQIEDYRKRMLYELLIGKICA